MNSERRGFLTTLAAWIGGLVFAGSNSTTTASVHSLSTPRRFELEEPKPSIPRGCEAMLVVSNVEFDEKTCSLVIYKRWLILPKGCIGPEA